MFGSEEAEMGGNPLFAGGAAAGAAAYGLHEVKTKDVSGLLLHASHPCLGGV